MFNTYNNKKILVTGNTGFKGSWLSIWLLELGAKVYGYSLPCKNDNDNYILCGLESKIDQTYGDVRNEDLINVCKKIKPDIIFHLAAQPLVLKSYEDPVETFSTNLIGTLNFLECVRNIPSIKSAINVTTDKVYENKDWVWGYRENDILGGKDPYSVSKVCSELMSDCYIKALKLNNLATIRAGNVIGGGDYAENRIVPDIIKAYRGNKTAIIRNPNASRPWQFILDCLHGYLTIGSALYRNNNFHGSWNIGPSENQNRTVIELVEYILQKIPGLQVDILSNTKQTEHQSLRLDVSKAKNEIGWSNKLNFQKTIDYTIDSYLSESDNTHDNLLSRTNQIRRYFLESRND